MKTSLLRNSLIFIYTAENYSVFFPRVTYFYVLFGFINYIYSEINFFTFDGKVLNWVVAFEVFNFLLFFNFIFLKYFFA